MQQAKTFFNQLHALNHIIDKVDFVDTILLGLNQRIICLFTILNRILLCPLMISTVCCLVKKPNWLWTLCNLKLLCL